MTVADNLRLTKTTVVQFVSSRKGVDLGAAAVLLLRGEPVWDGETVLGVGDHDVRVAAAPSPLAVHEQVLDHLAGRAGLLVVITDVEEHDLDPAILSRTSRRRIHMVDRWDIVREAFGASDVDPRLRAEAWACEALLDAAGAQGWPVTLAKGTLSRDTALAALVQRRIGVEREGDRIDSEALLRWSYSPGGAAHFRALRAAEQTGIAHFLGETEQSGTVGRVLLALVAAEHGPDAVAYGLLCAALWMHAGADNAVYQARGRAERWLADQIPAGAALDTAISAYAHACEDHVDGLLTAGRAEIAAFDADARTARRNAETMLTRADTLVMQFGAEHAAKASPTLSAGLTARFAAVGHALGRGDASAVASRARELRAHRLSGQHTVRVRRIDMAQRTLQWLDTDPDQTVDTVSATLDRHITETSWVDRALDAIEAGGDDDPSLATAYSALGMRVRDRRRDLDHEFARALARWTADGTEPGAMLTVETFLTRVIKPVVSAGRRVLLLVVDGMSAAIAAELGEQLRADWAEYDPLPDAAEPRRRGMAAALPTLTTVSRTSLFAGSLVRGTADDESRVFPEHRFWGSPGAAVFHKKDLRADTGDPYSPELRDALADPAKHVAVVLNTVDDRLAKEVKLGDGEWTVREIGHLSTLLTAAANLGMVVVITSDHGHVIDRHGTKITATDIGSARHRGPGGGLGATEVALTGRRVVCPEPGGSIVALWDADSRYTAQKAGYHGGASLAEVTIPVLAFLPFSATPPRGWRELGAPQPHWWNLEPMRIAPTQAKQAETKRRRVSRAAREIMAGAEPLFDLPPTRDSVAPQRDSVEFLLASPIFEAQLELLARKPAPDKLRAALEVLWHGPLPTSALAQRVGYPPARGDGFAAVLRQLLNVDGAQVLETLPDGRTLRLNTALLTTQFEIG